MSDIQKTKTRDFPFVPLTLERNKGKILMINKERRKKSIFRENLMEIELNIKQISEWNSVKQRALQAAEKLWAKKRNRNMKSEPNRASLQILETQKSDLQNGFPRFPFPTQIF